MKYKLTAGLSEEEEAQFKRDWAVALPARRRLVEVLTKEKEKGIQKLLTEKVEGDYSLKMATTSAEIREVETLLKILEKSL